MRQICLIFLLFFHIGLAQAQSVTNSDAKSQVLATEKAFAKSMAERDFSAFTAFLSDEAVFFSSSTVLHGKSDVAAAWKSYFDKPGAPFSWDSGQVEVLESGKLALSTGPVYDPDGKLIASFTSIWRMERPGVWHIVFDKGNSACVCAAK